MSGPSGPGRDSLWDSWPEPGGARENGGNKAGPKKTRLVALADFQPQPGRRPEGRSEAAGIPGPLPAMPEGLQGPGREAELFLLRRYAEKGREETMSRPAGFHHSEKTKNKIGDAHRGKIVSEVSREKISETRKRLHFPSWCKGLKLSKETREKISAARMGKYLGPDNPNWRGGKCIDDDGYVLLYCPGHPDSTRDGYVREHRLIAEDALGRFLKATEIVHHFNRTKSDNRPGNLVICENSGYHRFIESRGKKIVGG